MNNNRQTQVPPPTGLALGDIYYVLFRHKWKIIATAAAGFLAAGLYYSSKPPPYQSQAELLIQYVPQAGALPMMGSDQKVLVPDSRGEDIINSEIKIMTSLDLAMQAATNIGPAIILAKAGGGSGVNDAAGFIQGNLKAEPAETRSSVIVVTFKHPDPSVAQAVLQEIINDYFLKHKEIHSAGGQYDDALDRESTALSAQLNNTEQQLARLKNQNNIISIEDSRKGLAERISKIESAMLDARAELVSYEAVAQPGDSPSASIVETATNTPPEVVPAKEIDAYKTILASLDALRKKEQDYLIQRGYTSSNVLVLELEDQIASQQAAKDEVLARYPQIAGLGISAPPPVGAPVAGLDPQARAAQVAAIHAKLKIWETQLGHLYEEATNLNNLAPIISQLEKTKAIQEANYQNLATSIEKSRVDQALDTGKAPNIKWVQSPSPPFQDWKKTRKIAGMLAFGGVAAGLAWAFLLELVLDRSIRRSVEVQDRLRLPLFLSIPNVSRRRPLLLPGARDRRKLAAPAGVSEAVPVESPAVEPGQSGFTSQNGSGQIELLQPFYEALRDRLMVDFEVRKVTRKPKLVALTSPGTGAGVSTIAAGLAASLSQTGDGNVLLVDMNLEQGSAQQFYQGAPVCGLETALASDTKESAMVRENLYVVAGETGAGQLPRLLPSRFAALVPVLKASDYDFIIFDMPPVDQISITPRLAPFMDMVLMVIEAGKTDREAAKNSADMLAGSNVGVVFNKTRSYAPKSLRVEA